MTGAGPKRMLESSDGLFFGVGLTSCGWVRALQHKMLDLLNPFGFSSQRSYLLASTDSGLADLVGSKEDGGRCGTDGPMARPQEGGRYGWRLEERGGRPGWQ